MDFTLLEMNGIKYWLKDNHSKTTIVFVHGYQSFSDHFEPLCEFKNNYNIVSINYPGNSHYEQEIEMDAAEIAKVLDTFVSKIKTNVILLGHSFGGAIISSMKMTKKIKGLVFMSAFTTSILHSKAHSTMIGLGNKSIPPSLIDGLLSVASRKLKFDYEWASSFMKPGKGFKKLYKTNLINKEYIKNELDLNVKNIKKPIYSLIGKKDAVIPVAAYVDYFETLGVETQIIPKATHSPVKTNAEAVNEFLNKSFEFKKRIRKGIIKYT